MRRIKHLGVNVTTYCNLNCKECADLFPWFPMEHHDAELLKSDLDKVLAVTDFIEEVLIVGGECFVYPQINEVIRYCIEQPKIGLVIVVTNGTIMPSDETFEIMKRGNTMMRVSGYGENVAPIRPKLIQRIKDEGIPLHDLEGMVWQKIGKVYDRGRSEEEKKTIFKNCGMRECVGFNYKGEIHYCSRSSGLSIVESYPNMPKEEYVDVRNTPIEELGEALDAFFALDKLDACNYCDGLVGNSAILPAVQIVPKKIALELLYLKMKLEQSSERSVLMEWLQLLVDYKEIFTYQEEVGEPLTGTAEIFEGGEGDTITESEKERVLELWGRLLDEIFSRYVYRIEDDTHSIPPERIKQYDEIGRNQMHILVVNSEEEINGRTADIIVTPEDLEDKNSVLKYAFEL